MIVAHSLMKRGEHLKSMPPLGHLEAAGRRSSPPGKPLLDSVNGSPMSITSVTEDQTLHVLPMCSVFCAVKCIAARKCSGTGRLLNGWMYSVQALLFSGRNIALNKSPA